MTPPARIERYVALGDSQTEGLHDYHSDGLLRGWADRLAERLAEHHADMLYANLAVRGKRMGEIREEQLAAALRLAPDLATVVGGINDVLRPGANVDAIANELHALYGPLAETGCTVMTCTFPLPTVGLTRRLAPQLQALNGVIREAAKPHGVLVVECEDVAVAADLRLWDSDRIHLNPSGHTRLADAFGATLMGAGEGWKDPLSPPRESSAAGRLLAETAWIGRYLVPKLVRLARGRSSGDGRIAKRPELEPVVRG